MRAWKMLARPRKQLLDKQMNVVERIRNDLLGLKLLTR